MPAPHAPSVEKQPIDRRWDRRCERFAKRIAFPAIVVSAIAGWAGSKVFSTIGNSEKFERMGRTVRTLSESESRADRIVGNTGTWIHERMSNVAKLSTDIDAWQLKQESDSEVCRLWGEAKAAAERGDWQVAGEHICELRKYDRTVYPEQEEPGIYIGIAEAAFNQSLVHFENAARTGTVTKDDCYNLGRLVYALYWDRTPPAALLEKIKKEEDALPYDCDDESGT